MTSGATALLGLQPQLRRQNDGRMECDARTRGVRVLDSRRDLRDATPETLTRAPLCRVASTILCNFQSEHEKAAEPKTPDVGLGVRLPVPASGQTTPATPRRSRAPWRPLTRRRRGR